MKPLCRVLGGILIAVGLPVMLYGGYLGAIYTSDGGQPHYVAGFALCVGGLFIAGLGMVLCGIVTLDELWNG